MIMQSFMAGTALSLTLISTIPAYAIERAYPAGGDKRIQHVVYNPDKVVSLRAVMGMEMTISFGDEEHVVKVAASDQSRLKTDIIKGGNEQLANYLFLKPSILQDDPPGYVLPTQPLTVITEHKGSLKRYHFRIQTLTEDAEAYDAVVFQYPDEERNSRNAEAQERARLAQAAQTHNLLSRETNLVSVVGATSSEPRNYNYSARGDYSLAPAWVWDNGYSTYFNWPGMQHNPSIFKGYCGPNEATADGSTHSNDTVIVPGTAQVWCLRDQHSAIEIFNLGYTVAGSNPGTQTISPYVKRGVKNGR